jgi:hypothetical protein
MATATRPEHTDSGIAKNAIDALRRFDPANIGRRYLALSIILVVCALAAIGTFGLILFGPTLSQPASRFAVIALVAAFGTTVTTALFLGAGMLQAFAEHRLAQVKAASAELELTDQLTALQQASGPAARVLIDVMAAPEAMRGAMLTAHQAEVAKFTERLTADSH